MKTHSTKETTWKLSKSNFSYTYAVVHFGPAGLASFFGPFLLVCVSIVALLIAFAGIVVFFVPVEQFGDEQEKIVGHRKLTLSPYASVVHQFVHYFGLALIVFTCYSLTTYFAGGTYATIVALGWSVPTAMIAVIKTFRMYNDEEIE